MFFGPYLLQNNPWDMRQVIYSLHFDVFEILHNQKINFYRE